MEDFIDKKEKFADLIEEYMEDPSKKDDLISYVGKLISDPDFRDKPLFLNIFNEFNNYLNELSQKELKQRVLMVRTFIP